MPATRILVVENEAIIAKDIQRKLEAKGYEVPDIATTGDEALHKVASLKPDLVLMDIRLQGEMDGVAAAEQIRARFRLPVVYLTAYMDDATVQRAKLTQPFGYLLKPFQVKELHTAIEIALYRREMERKLEAAHSQLERRVRELEARDDLVRLQMSAPTLQQARAEVLQTLARGLVVPELGLWWPDPHSGNLALVAAHGFSSPAFGSSQDLAERAFQESRLQERPDQGEAAVPVVYRDTALGALWVGGLGSQAGPWDEAVQVLQRLAQQATLVLRMAHMAEDLDSGKVRVADLLALEAEEGDGPT